MERWEAFRRQKGLEGPASLQLCGFSCTGLAFGAEQCGNPRSPRGTSIFLPHFRVHLGSGKLLTDDEETSSCLHDLRYFTSPLLLLSAAIDFCSIMI